VGKATHGLLPAFVLFPGVCYLQAIYHTEHLQMSGYVAVPALVLLLYKGQVLAGWPSQSDLEWPILLTQQQSAMEKLGTDRASFAEQVRVLCT
jgi:hypothetical protein